MISYGYDNANQLTSMTQGTALVIFGDDEVNQRISLILLKAVQISYGYDDGSRLESVIYNRGVVVLNDLSYKYDAAGR